MLRACAQLFERGDERADQGVRRAGINRCRWQVPTRRLGVGGSGRFKEAPRRDPVKASPGAENSRIGDDPMTHKFHVGETVTIRPAISRNVPGGIYVVTKRLPDNSGESTNIELRARTNRMSASRWKVSCRKRRAAAIFLSLRNRSRSDPTLSGPDALRAGRAGCPVIRGYATVRGSCHARPDQLQASRNAQPPRCRRPQHRDRITRDRK